MGALGGLLGTAGGAAGSGFKNPGQAQIQTPITGANVQSSMGNVNNSIQSQQDLLNALQGQGGLNQQTIAAMQAQQLAGQLAGNQGAINQGQVFNQSQGLANQLAANNGAMNTRNAIMQQQQLSNQLAGSNGIGAQTGALAQQGGFNSQLAQANGIGTQNAAVQGLKNLANQQQGTAQQYQNIANGTGPNPAQAALNQATGQNVANQAALMAGQRGASANVGLMARLAAQQGANTQQQAVGQSALMQANQQLAGLSGLSQQQQALGATQQALGSMGTTQAGMQQSGITNQASQAAQLAAQQQAAIAQQAQQAQAQVAAQQAQQQQLAGQAANQVAAQQGAQQALASQANTLSGQQIGQTQAINAAQQAQQNALISGLGAQNTAGVQSQASVNSGNTTLADRTLQGQQAGVGGLLNAAGPAIANGAGAAASAIGALFAAGGGEIKKPGPSSAFGQFLRAKMAGGGEMPHNLIEGGPVIATTPDQKAKVKGNSYSNDKIPALVSEDEIVLPRTVTQSKDPVRSSAEFVANILAKRGK